MSEALSLLGATLIVGSALLLSRGYSAFIGKRRAQNEDFYRFLLHIKGEISRFLTPPDRLLCGFQSKVLEEIGFSESALKDGKGSLISLFLSVRERLSVSENVKELLEEFFIGFGEDYKDGELKRCDGYAERLAELIGREGEELEKGEKLVRAVLCAASLGIVILLI